MIWLLTMMLWFGVDRDALAADPASVEHAFEMVSSRYPDYRNYWGAFAVTGGVYSGSRGLKELFSSSDTLSTLAGFGLAFTGWVTFFDGIRLLKGLSEPEVVATRYQNYAPGTAKDFGGVVSREEFGRTRLVALSDEAYTGRILRMASHFITAGSFFYFYVAGTDKGSIFLLIPGIVFTGAGFYRLMQDSPEESGATFMRSSGPASATWRVFPAMSSLWIRISF